MIHCISVVSQVTALVSFLIWFIWALSLWIWLKVYQFYSFREPFLSFMDKFYFFFFLPLFYLFLLWFLIFLSSTNSRLCFSLSGSISCMFFSCFLAQACITIEFLLRVAFAVSHSFWIIVSVFIVPTYFWVSSLTIQWPICCLTSLCLASMYFLLSSLIVDYVWNKILQVSLIPSLSSMSTSNLTNIRFL